MRAAPLVLLLLASTLTVMAGAVLTPVVELLRGDLGLTSTQAGMVVTAHTAVIAVSAPAVGWAMDRWGYRTPLGAGLLLYGVAGGAGALADSYPVLIATRLVFGLGAAAVFAASTVAMLALYRGELRDRAMGWRSTAVSFGGVVCPLLGGALGGLSWHAPFAVYLVGVPLGLAVLALLPDARPEAPARGARGARFRPSPAVLGFLLLTVAATMMLYSLVVFVPQRLAELGVTHPSLVSVYPVSWSAAMGLVGVGYARLRARLGYAWMLRLSAALWTASFALLALGGGPVPVWAAVVLFGLGSGIAIPALTVLVGGGVPAALRGRATALVTTATFAGQFLAPPALGPVVEGLSIGTAYLLVSAGAAVLLAVLLAVRVTDPEAAPDGS
ncbi:MFS transporter [Nocardiopsis composta]|uniref:MFS family permease n=1 Tax=Nocardiopsis composta TaxID=157465 RepID=A0A7W8QMS2_9ACTN|nr:MFS transporter [Nocardiopsis composta]MBB5433144.1 MFS family permease [Nocardiopsis composta]